MNSVLILDDDAAVRERLRRLLARAAPDAHVLEADSLRAAKALLSASPIDTALIDVGLPDGSGLLLLPVLQGRTPATDAIVVTSLGDDATVLEALRTMQHRLWDCFRQQRWPVPEYGSDAITALTVFLQKQASAGELNVPSIKR